MSDMSEHPKVIELLKLVESRGRLPDSEVPERYRNQLAICGGGPRPLIARVSVAGVGFATLPLIWELSLDGRAALGRHEMGEADAESEPAKEAENGEPEPVDMSWQEAAERLKRLRDQGEPFTSQHKLAEAFGCSSGTINKAIRNTKALHGWAKRQAAPRSQSINDMVTDGTLQRTEPDPADDAAIREFIEQADAQTKAWFLALSRENQLAVLVTLDRDFSDIRAYPPSEYPGIMALSVIRQDKAHVIDVLRRAIALFGTQPITGHLWIVEDHCVRIRGGGA